MRRNLLLTITLLLLSGGSFAQEKEWAIFDFYVGASFPLGNFGTNDLEDGAYAKTGFALGVGPNWYLSDSWGVFFHLGYQQNQVDRTALENDLKLAIPAINTVSYEGGDYSSILAMVGPSYTVRFSNEIRLILKAGMGMFSAFQSDVILAVNGSSETIAADSRFRFAPFVSTGVSFPVSSRFDVLINADFSTANPEYDLRIGDFNLVTEKQRQTYVNIGAGMSLRID